VQPRPILVVELIRLVDQRQLRLGALGQIYALVDDDLPVLAFPAERMARKSRRRVRRVLPRRSRR
jgi:hypothetical protein